MTSPYSYNLSFTAGAAMLMETHAVAQVLIECNGDWASTKKRVFEENVMQKDKLSSTSRYFALIKQRLETLTAEEIILLANSPVAIQRQMILLAICKAYRFIYDFVNEIVRDAYYNRYEKISKTSFNEFFNEKKYEHPELEKVTEKSVGKMRQVLFRILEQTELIEDANSGILHRPYLNSTVEQTIVKDNPLLLAVFLYSNSEIESVTN